MSDSIREVTQEDKKKFNSLALHPLQSWEWGEFRKKMGISVVRLGRFQNAILSEIAQISFHQIPHTGFTIGYVPKGCIPTKEMCTALIACGKEKKAIFIKLEPHIPKSHAHEFPYSDFPLLLRSPHPLFTTYTFQLNLIPGEGELMGKMHPKTRYNIRVAQKHGVLIRKDTRSTAFEAYWNLMHETTKRQHFYAHTKSYHETMWKLLSEAGIAHLFTATYRGEIIVTWIVFLFNSILYYPYGASSMLHRNVMASNLMMWETIRWGKEKGAKIYDMWGALGPNPDHQNPWYGFHKFKEGFGPDLVQFVGSYDLVVNRKLYPLYNFVHSLREKYLLLSSRFMT